MNKSKIELKKKITCENCTFKTMTMTDASERLGTSCFTAQEKPKGLNE